MTGRTRLFVGGGVAVAVLAVATQLVLPGLAARRISGELQRYGPRPDVEVAAFPAVKLLFGRADRVTVRASMARLDQGPLLDEITDTGRADTLDVRIAELRIGTLALQDVVLGKDGRRATGAATVTPRMLQGALRQFVDLKVVDGAAGDGIVLEGTVTVLGRGVRGRARVTPDDGRLVVGLDGLPFGTITVVDDKRLRVTAVGATQVGDSYRLSIGGTLAEG